jgi:polar amino acid transport system substrate-binding protein
MISGVAKRLLAAALLTCAGTSAHGDGAPIRLYTHGDTYPAQWSEEGGISGVAIKVAVCAFKRLDRTVTFELAPLSRATELMDTQDNALWYPSILAGDEERMARLVGPVSRVELMWYYLRNAKLKPGANDFREHAKVTAYTGSRTEVMLKGEGYTLVPGSADHMRLVHLVASGSVDAVLAVDFRWKLPDATRALVAKHMDTALYKSFPVAYQVSRSLAAREPAFIGEFQQAVDGCKAELPTAAVVDRSPAH